MLRLIRRRKRVPSASVAVVILALGLAAGGRRRALDAAPRRRCHQRLPQQVEWGAAGARRRASRAGATSSRCSGACADRPVPLGSPGPAGARGATGAAGAARPGLGLHARGHGLHDRGRLVGHAARANRRRAATSPSSVVPPIDPYAKPKLVLNEIDYDQVGADSGGFVELFNAGRGTVDLGGLALVLRRRGRRAAEYLRIPLSGVDPRRRLPGRPGRRRRTARPTVSRSSTRSIRNCSTRSRTKGRSSAPLSASFAYNLVEGTVLPPSVADSDTITGSLARLPNGSRHERRRHRLGVHQTVDTGKSELRRLADAHRLPFARIRSRGPRAPTFAQRFRSSACRRLSSRRSRCASSRCSFL